MIDGVTLRPVTAEDLDFLREMTLLAAFPPGAVPDGATELPRVRRWTEDWGRPTDAGVVAWRGPERIGAAWCRVQEEVLLRDDSDRALPELAIAVLPASRGRGVGGELLRGVELAASGAGHQALSLTVHATNPALRLYERAGFTIVRRDGDRVTMNKPLG